MKISPSVNLVVTMLLAMILLTGFALLLRNIFRSYRHKLELYQHLLVDFMPDNLVEVAVRYQPEDPIILEESNYDESSYRGSTRQDRYNKVTLFSPKHDRVSAPLGNRANSLRRVEAH
jgi:hypothetical protein